MNFDRAKVERAKKLYPPGTRVELVSLCNEERDMPVGLRGTVVSIREWQQRYANGEFSSSDFDTQVKAGWYDWFCDDRALAGRLKKLAGAVMGVRDPFILDNYYVWFKNNCPLKFPLYDDVRFEPLSGERNGRFFIATLNSPYEEKRWTLHTERNGFEKPEANFDSVRELTEYINKIGPELQQIQPESELLETLDTGEEQTGGSHGLEMQGL